MVGLGRLAARQLVAQHREDETRSQDRQQPYQLSLQDLLPAIVEPTLEYLHGQPPLKGRHGDRYHDEKDFERIHDARTLSSERTAKC